MPSPFSATARSEKQTNGHFFTVFDITCTACGGYGKGVDPSDVFGVSHAASCDFYRPPVKKPDVYIQRPVPVEAVQWTGENPCEVRDFLRSSEFATISHDAIEQTFVVIDEGHAKCAVPGDWIVRDGHDFHVLGDSDFLRHYVKEAANIRPAEREALV